MTDETRPDERWTVAEIKQAVSWWQSIPVEHIQNVVVIIQPVPEVQAVEGLPIIHSFANPDAVIWLLGQIIGSRGGHVIVEPSDIPRTECALGHQLNTDGMHIIIAEACEHDRELQ